MRIKIFDIPDKCWSNNTAQLCHFCEAQNSYSSCTLYNERFLIKDNECNKSVDKPAFCVANKVKIIIYENGESEIK